MAFEADLWFETSSFFSKSVEERGLIDILADAWRNLDATELHSFIHKDFQYDSQWVFATMHADEYPSYIRGKFDTIRKTGAAPTVEIVPDRSFGGRMIKLVQRKDVGYLRIKEKDGKIVKMDMCMF